jgi:Lon protease-like protein
MTADHLETIPLFPLQTVLFPDGPLPLRVFEPRYLDMISRCMKDDAEFGVVLIQSGSETGDVETMSIGTTARIFDWNQGSDGILGITAVGKRRFRIEEMSRQPDRLNCGRIEVLEAEITSAIPREYDSMVELLKAVIDDLGQLYQDFDLSYDDATWVGRRFAEILPISNNQKQYCLEMNDPIERLAYIQPLLRSIRPDTTQ